MLLPRELIALLLATLLALMNAAVFAQEDKDIPAVRRIPVPAGTTIADLASKTDGVLVELPLAAFESRLDRAAAGAAKLSPRLIKSIYRADLRGNFLTAGSAQWIIENPAAATAVLPLSSFNLAVKQPRLEGEPALLGDLDGQNLGLVLEKQRTQSLTFDWSLRATPGVQGSTFDLRIPSCPLTSFEIKAPADQTLSLPTGAGLVTGPHDTETPTFKLWRLHVAGKSQIELLVRHGNDPGHPPRVVTANELRVRFTPEHTHYDFEAQVEVLHSPVQNIVFEIDPSMKVFEVTSRQGLVASWKLDPPREGKNRPQLTIQCREPLLGTANVRVALTAPRWPEQDTNLPRVDVVGAIPRGETIKLQLQPDQQLERWNAGSFRLANSTKDPGGDQVLTLVDTQPDGKGSRPRFLLRGEGVDFVVTQDIEWRPDAGSIMRSAEAKVEWPLTSVLQFDVSRGQLYSLQVKLPKNAGSQAPWQVASVALEPPDLLQSWNVSAGVLLVELKQGVTPRSGCKLTVNLQDDKGSPANKSRTLDFPDLEPVGAQLRTSSLAILAEPNQQLSLVSSNVPTSRPGPSLAKNPRLQFFFTGRQSAIQGKIKLSEQPPLLQARVSEKISLSADASRVTAVVTVEPIVGQPTSIDLFCSGCGLETWTIDAKGAEIVSKEALPSAEIMSLSLRLGAARSMAGLIEPRGRVWRMHFRQPLTKAVTLTMQQDLAPTAKDIAAAPPLLALDRGLPLLASALAARVQLEWRAPIIIPLDAERLDGEVSVEQSGLTMTGVNATGLDSAGATLARPFRFRGGSLISAPSLIVTAQRRLDDAGQAIIDIAHLSTVVDSAGNATHHLRASVWNWRTASMRIGLPAGTFVLGGRLDGADLDRLPRVAREGGVDVFVPMSRSPRAQIVELSYRTPASPFIGPLGVSLTTAMPKLPTSPLVVRRELHLADDWLPLRQESMFSLDSRSPARDDVSAVWQFGEGLVNEFLPTLPPAWIEIQRLGMLGAEGSLSRAGAREMSFAAAMSHLMLDAKKSPIALVLDRESLSALGIGPETTITLAPESSTPFWERLGLVYVPTPHAALLTSRERAAAWSGAIRREAASSVLLTDCVRHAAERGRDASSQFIAADAWLRSDRRDADHPLPDGGRWIPLAGRDGDSIVLVRPSRVRQAAVFLALLTLAAAVILHGGMSPAAYFRMLVVALAAAGVALITAPASIRELALGPLGSVLCLLAVSYRHLLKLPRPQSRPQSPSRKSPSTQKAAKAVISGAVLLLAAWIGAAIAIAQAPPEPEIVSIMGAGENARVFVRREFLTALDAADRGAPKLDDVVILASRYKGRWEAEGATLTAEFDVWAFKDKTSLIVPLTGVDLLEGSFLDGTPVLPVVAGGGKVGYQITVPEKGGHRLSLKFLVRPQAGDLKFSGPQTVATSLHLTAPGKFGAIHLARSWGEESLEARNGEQILVAELGHESTVQVLGPPAKSTAAAGMHVREFYAWDLRPGNRSAQAIITYVPVGSVGSVELQIPPTLEVRGVEVIDTAGKIVPLKSWRLSPREDGQLLRMETVQPTSTAFTALLTMTPRWPGATGPIELRLPLPLKATSDGGMMGIRFDEPDAVLKASSLGTAPKLPDAFAKEWHRLSQRDPPVVSQAFTIARSTKNAAAAAVEVTPLAAAVRVQSDVTWTGQPKSIDLIGRLAIASADDMVLVPIALPEGIVLRDVQGVDVHHWSRFGGAVQVWLSGPRKKTNLTVLGWIAPGGAAKSVALPVPKIAGGTVDVATVTLASAANFTLEPKIVPGLVEELAESGQRRFRVQSGEPPTEFLVKPLSAAPEYQSLTTIESMADRCAVGIHVVGRIDQGDFPEVVVRAPRWPSSMPRLIFANPGVKVQHASPSPDEHVWTIKFPSGSPQQVAFEIKSIVPLTTGQTLIVPDIQIDKGGAYTERVLALVGAQVAGKSPLKFAPMLSPTKELAPWPLEYKRLKAAGATSARWPADSAVAVLLREATITPAAQVLAARRLIQIGEPDRWLHRMTWTIWAKSGVELDVRTPAGARLAAVFIDDAPATPRIVSPESFTLPLPPGLRPRQVAVCWTYPATKEPFDRPHLERASLIGLVVPAPQLRIDVPAGWQLSLPAPNLAAALLDDTQRQARILRAVTDDLGAPTKTTLSNLAQPVAKFASLARHARARSQGLDPAERDAALEQIASLQADVQSRTQKLGIEAVRDAADKQPWTVASDTDASVDGVPTTFVNLGEAQRPLLLPATEGRVRWGLALTLVFVFAISFSPLILRWWIVLWPEQLAAITLVGISIGGFSLLAGGLLVIAILGRAIGITHGVQRWIRHAWRKKPHPLSTFGRPA